MNRISKLHIAEPEQLGEIVLSRLGQSIEIGHNDGTPEIYFAANGSPAKLFVLDLYSGHIKHEFNLHIADAIWAMTMGADGCIYLAGTSGNVLYRYHPVKEQLESLNQFPSDPWVWELSASRDGLIYGATYPEAKIFQYDINENMYMDLGRADEHSTYARTIYSTDKHLYVGLGSTVKVVRLCKATHAWSEIILEGYSGLQGFAERITVIDQLLFVYVQKHATLVYDLETENIIAKLNTSGAIVQGESEDSDNIYYVEQNQIRRWNKVSNYDEYVCQKKLKAGAVLGGVKAIRWINRQQDDAQAGKVLSFATAHGYCYIYDPRLNRSYEITQHIPYMSINIHSIIADHKNLYVGGYHRALSVWNIAEEKLDFNFPHFPQIEGMLFSNQELYFGVYTQAYVYRYTPNKPISVGSTEQQLLPNPACLFKIGEGQDRPFAIAEGDDYIFFGTVADYGLLDGAVTIYNKQLDKYKVLKGIVPNQSVVGLAYKDGLLYGSTSVWGGLGSEPVEAKAKLFIWDVINDKLIDIFTPLEDVIDETPKMIGELSFGPDGLLWGIIEGTIFAYDTSTMTIVKWRQYYPSLYQYSKWRPCFLRWEQDGLLYTTLDRKLVIIDPETLEHRTVDENPHGLIAVGPDGHMYYAEGPILIRRKIVR